MNSLAAMARHLLGGADWALLALTAEVLAAWAVSQSRLALPGYYRRIWCGWFLFFGVVCLETGGTFVVLRLTTDLGPPPLFGAMSLLSFYSMVMVCLWASPGRNWEDGRAERQELQRMGAPGLGVKLPQLRLRPQTSSLGLKVIYTGFLVFVPLVVFIHVSRGWEVYGEDLRLWLRVTGEAEQTELGSEPTKTVGALISAMRLHFIGSPDLLCGQEEVSCSDLMRRLGRIQNDRLVFVSRAFFFFLLVYPVFSYLAWLLLVRNDAEEESDGGLGLKEDVIVKSATLLSPAGALLCGLFMAGFDLKSIGLFSGLVGAGVSIALRDLLANLISGVLLLWDRTIKRGDVITLPPSASSDTGSTYGIVKQMTMRYTVVEDRNDVRRLVPNSYFTNNVVENWTHENSRVRLRIFVSVSYGEDLGRVKKVLESVCYEVKDIVKTGTPPKAMVVGLEDSGVVFSVRFWIEDPARGLRPVLSDVYIFIYERLRDEGISIPFPQQDVHLPGVERLLRDGCDARFIGKEAV